MSGISDSTTCPNCKSEADLYSDWKPFDYSIIQCYECGLNISPELSYMDLEEVNYMRTDNDLEPLKKLPKQNESVW